MLSSGESRIDDPETYVIIGAAMRVHRLLGPGFREPIYHEALGLELASRHVRFTAAPLIEVFYDGRPLEARFRPDFICFDSVIVELKAVAQLGSLEFQQVIGYLKATRHERGLLLNFGRQRLEYRRFRSGAADLNGDSGIRADGPDERR